MMRFLLALQFTIVFCFFSKAQRLVLPGAHPDPSVVKIGNTYWASCTSSNWFPLFPLLYSTDLITWKQKGYIFDKMPEWADYYFWAPEMTYDSGKVYVYYTAHKKNGNLCIGVATADKPEGPYKDLGPIKCQAFGSIDAFPIRDTSGRLYLIWKEDANSVGRPTPIYASEMNNERTALIGEKIELFRNDKNWEQDLVEGVSMMRHGDYYYAFYAAAGCCGSGCTYVSGVARARDVLGPWEKYYKNPILTDTGNWICKGHGTPIERNGRYYFLYHGYDRITSAFTGREGLLQEFRFTPDNWIEFVGISTDSIQRNQLITDDFTEKKLPEKWQWSVFQDVKYQLNNGQLRLNALPNPSGSFLGEKIVSADYTATAVVDASQSTALAGLGAIGDDDNIVALFCKNEQLQIFKLENGNDTVIASFSIPPKDKVYLQMRVRGPYRISFLYSTDGKNFVPLTKTPIRGAYLPPWDNPPRVGLFSKGSPQQVAVFEHFEIAAGVLNPPDIESGRIFRRILYIILAGTITWTAIYFYRKARHRKQLLAES